MLLLPKPTKVIDAGRSVEDHSGSERRPTMPHTQYHPQSVPLPEPQDNDDDEEPRELHDGLVPPDIEDDPEHDRRIDPED